MGKTFFIADTHFGHKSIIDYENRPFKNISDMDNILISNWNNTVSEDDTVFLLGDFSAYSQEETKKICNMLNGHKFLIMGNHDTESEKYYYDCGFENVSRYPIIYENFWILSHEPMYININMPYANIFGHVHSNPIYKDFSERSYCVSAERTGYIPVDFQRIKEIIERENKK